MDEHYLDHAATTPVHPAVLEAMLPYFGVQFGNPSSLHAAGRRARHAISESRDQIAEYLGCSPRKLIFTSGGTESDNLAILGSLSALKGLEKPHIITTQIEHQAVLAACGHVECLGGYHEVTYLPVDPFGIVSVHDFEAELTKQTGLVSMMYGNNEVGSLQPIEEVGKICRKRRILFHVDAVQALGIAPIELSSMPVDLVSLSAHKINGPKGCGLLYCDKDHLLDARMFGGNQERTRRPGTENVAAIVGFAKAIQLAVHAQEEKSQQAARLRKLFIETLAQTIGADSFYVNGHPEQHLPHILNISFPGIDRETMLMNLDLMGIAASGGSACTSGSLEDSHVLIAMGLPSAIIKSSVRFSFGYETTESSIIDVTQKIGTIVVRLRRNI